MEAEGIPAWRRTFIYLGVKIGGTSSWLEDARGRGHLIVGGRIVQVTGAAVCRRLHAASPFPTGRCGDCCCFGPRDSQAIAL